MQEDLTVRTCALDGCDAPVPDTRKKFCSRKHAQKFHNSARDPEEMKARRKDWMARNPEWSSKYQREKYAKNRDKMVARQKAYYHANIDRCREGNKRSHAKRPWRGLLATARKRALEKQIEFSLTADWARGVWTGKCAITGLAFVKGDGAGPAPFSPTIDRIDLSKGYTPDNSRFILMGVNATKGRGTDADMLLIAKAIVDKLSPS